MNALYDSHCHLDDPAFEADLESVLARAKDAGVSSMITVGCARSFEDLDRALELARKHPETLRATVGVHPHDASFFSRELGGRMRALADDPLVVAIGETGLDYHYNHSAPEVQRNVFRDCIAIAKDANKPIVVHTRNAKEETLKILEEDHAKGVKGVIHCFSEDWGFASRCIDLGFFISFSGIATFKSAVAVQDAAKKVPQEFLLIETDAPYLSPVPLRGRRNEPSHVAHTLACLAALRNEDPKDLAAATFDNAMRLFRRKTGEEALTL